jgi:hypothetical protein
MLDSYEQRATQPETVEHFLKWTGTVGTATKIFGPGMTITWISTGVIDVTWSDPPGTYLGLTHGFQATTIAALKGYTIVSGDFAVTTRTLRLNVTNSTFALADLIANQYGCLAIKFKQTAV